MEAVLTLQEGPVCVIKTPGWRVVSLLPWFFSWDSIHSYLHLRFWLFLSINNWNTVWYHVKHSSTLQDCNYTTAQIISVMYISIHLSLKYNSYLLSHTSLKTDYNSVSLTPDTCFYILLSDLCNFYYKMNYQWEHRAMTRVQNFKNNLIRIWYAPLTNSGRPVGFFEDWGPHLKMTISTLLPI